MEKSKAVKRPTTGAIGIGEGPDREDDGPRLAYGRRADIVYEELFRRIVSGELPPGGKLPGENSLSEMFGISRPIVRQALRRLRIDGIIESRKGAGSFVREADLLDSPDQDIEQRMADCLRLFEYRLTVEPGIAAIAAKRATDDQLDAIWRAVESDRESLERGEVKPDREVDVHLSIAKATENDHIIGSVLMVRTEINLNTYFIRTLMRHPPHTEHLDEVCRGHRSIYDAIAHRDPEEARAAMRRHLEIGRNFMLESNLEILKKLGK